MDFTLLKSLWKMKQKQIISFIILSCLFLSLLIILQIYAQITKNLVPKLQNRDENRIIYMSFDSNKFEKFYNLLNQEKIRNTNYYVNNIPAYNEEFGDLTISSLPLNDKVEIQKGENFDNNSNEIIISEQLYKNISKDMINSSISLYTKNKVIHCRIVGIYKNQESNFFNKVYVSNDIAEQLQSDRIELLIKAKHQNEVDHIIQLFQFNDIHAELFDNSYQTEANEYLSLLTIIKPFFCIIIMLCIIDVFIFINTIINEKMLLLILLKLSGFTNLLISFNVFFAIFSFTAIVFLILNIFVFCIFKIVNYILNINLIFYLSYSIYIFILASILILVVILYLIYKIKNKKILNILYTN